VKGERCCVRCCSNAPWAQGRRGAALEMCGLLDSERSIARIGKGHICRGSLLAWHDGKFLQTQRVEATCIPGASRLSERHICHGF
jgi:hypothetical protein